MPELRQTEHNGLVFYQSPQLMACPGLRHGFFTRCGGVSPGLDFRFTPENMEKAPENYRLAAEALGFSREDVVYSRQRHTDRIVEIREKSGFHAAVPPEESADALVTNLRGVCLTGFFADCQLTMLYDRRQHALAVAHSGWRGVVQNILPKTIARMEALYGTRPRDLIAAVSPSICRSCFETDSDVYEAMRDLLGESVDDYVYREGEKWHIDLRNITYIALMQAGVPPLNIDLSNICPCCGDPELFWSHRRCGEARGVHAGMIGLAE